ncbi:oligosaccharide flippase family protein [Stutzerimonas balearica]|uniref:oligosaccharide flippase family protein n=1 Tax=Stutzerimonas balearica TaxID=74829 RepID=UPI0028A05A02|nr:oligosaccharide flippase family protein [Stutzerimonas balearica]
MKVNLLSAITNSLGQSLIRLGLSLLTLKLVSGVLGPTGFAIYGQLQSVLQIASSAASSITTTGVVKQIAQDRDAVGKVLTSACLLVFYLSLILTVLVIIFSKTIAVTILEGNYSSLVCFVPATALAVGIGSLYFSYVNAVQNYRQCLAYAVVTSLIMFLVTLVLVVVLGRQGAMLSLIVSPVIATVIVLLFWGRPLLRSLLGQIRWDPSTASDLCKYSLSAIVGVISVYGSQIVIREIISSAYGGHAAGVWYATTRVSEVYMGVAATLYSMILIPEFSKTQKMDVGLLLLKFSGCSLCAAVVLVSGVLLFSELFVYFVFGESFAGVVDLLKAHSVGDALKLISWVFLYRLLATGELKIFLAIEVFSSLLFLGLVYFSVENIELDFVPVLYVIQSAFTLSILFLNYMWRRSYRAGE